LPGVVITAHVQGVHNPKSEEFSFAPHVVVVVTDALGRYSAGYMNVADVVFAAAGYDTLNLCWPYDLKKDDPCAGLVDVFLSRTRDVKHK